MLVEVKKKHIEEGRKRNRAACPVALALNERLLPPCAARVSASVVSVLTTHATGQSHITARSPLTKRTRKFIRDFDTGEQVAPFRFFVNKDVEIWMMSS